MRRRRIVAICRASEGCCANANLGDRANIDTGFVAHTGIGADCASVIAEDGPDRGVRRRCNVWVKPGD